MGNWETFPKGVVPFPHSNQKWMEVSGAPHACHLCCQTRSLLVVVKGFQTVVLLYIYLMTNDIEYLFMCLVTILISLVKCLLNIPGHKNFFIVENLYTAKYAILAILKGTIQSYNTANIIYNIVQLSPLFVSQTFSSTQRHYHH